MVAKGVDCPQDLEIKGSFGDELRSLFQAGQTIIGVCAAGIIIRLLAPVILEKADEPPVLCASEDCKTFIPLLGGHRGGNNLAKELAATLGGQAAVTTASDISLGVALDDPPDGWRLENPVDAKAAMAALLSGAKVRLSGITSWISPLTGLPNFEPGPDADDPSVIICLVDGCEPLVYRRQIYTVGVGCSRGCTPDEMAGLVHKVLADHGISRFALASVGTIDVKMNEEAVLHLSQDLDIPLRFYTAERLEKEASKVLRPSEIVKAAVGTRSVAEAAALAAAGPDADLYVPKHKSDCATCAVARCRNLPGDPGRPRGRLAIVGIGPGSASWRSPEASRLIAESEELVGYGPYLDLLGPLLPGKRRRDFQLGQEEERCRYAMERAREGRRIAIICSGDPGIYAMAALVTGLLDTELQAGGGQASLRSEFVIAPGISAMQAAAAGAGALLGHDFCAVSLSDILTPREDILRRIEAAGIGDFVLAIYNPASRRRRELLGRAREILLRYRKPETPVLLAQNLGRKGEQLKVGQLGRLSVEDVDMMTTVLVGSSHSRAFFTGNRLAGAEGWMLYTPRGYGHLVGSSE